MPALPSAWRKLSEVVAAMVAGARLAHRYPTTGLASDQHKRNQTPYTRNKQRYKRLELWLGSLPDGERQRREEQGQRVVPLQNLQPWGKAVTLFANGTTERSIGLAGETEPVKKASVGGNTPIHI